MQCRALLMAENQINFDLCILCQTQNNEQPVDNPASLEKVVEFVKECAKLSDLRYLELWPKLKAVSVDELKKEMQHGIGIGVATRILCILPF